MPYATRGITIFCFILLFAACKTTDTATNKKNRVVLTVLDSGYFLKNDVVLDNDISCMVATEQSMLDNNFGYGAVMGVTHTPIDFSKEMVLAIVAKQSNREMKLSFNNAKLTTNDLVVNITVVKGDDLSYEASPIALASVQLNEDIKTVSFYRNDKLIRKVEL